MKIFVVTCRDLQNSLCYNIFIRLYIDKIYSHGYNKAYDKDRNFMFEM